MNEKISWKERVLSLFILLGIVCSGYELIPIDAEECWRVFRYGRVREKQRVKE
jgi:hypothetical protein